MAKKLEKPAQTIINDLRVEVRSVDRSRKDLDKVRQALLSAENIIRPTRQLLYDVYEDILLDDHLRSVMEQRRLAVTTTTLVFQNNGKPVESINKLIKTQMFKKIIEHALDSVFYGYSLIKADFNLKKAELVPRAHVIPSKGLVVERPYDLDGIDYTVPPFTRFYLGVGEPKDLGLLLVAAFLVLIKRGNLSDWAQFNEIFGQPTRVGKYDPNMPGQKEQILEALREAGAMAYIAVPVGSELTFVEANKSGATDTYGNLFDRMEAGMSKLIVGQTMTTTNGSSRSQGEVHERVATKIAHSDREFIINLLNDGLRQMLIAQGFSDAAQGEFQFMEEEERLTKAERLKMDLDIHKTVGPLKKEYYATEYNVDFVDMSDEPKPEPETPLQPQPGKPKGKQGKQKPDDLKLMFEPTPDQLKIMLELSTRLNDFFV